MTDLPAGLVPLKPVREAIEAAMDISDWDADLFGDIDERLMPLTRMWPMDEFRKSFTHPSRKYIPFDYADQVLCLLGLQHLWWNELAGIYYKADLHRPGHTRLAARGMGHTRPVPKGKLRCAAEGCSEIFKPKRAGHKFCCSRCMGTQWYRDHIGQQTLQNKHIDKCPKGHDRSPENVRYEKNKNGVMCLRCRTCQTERQRARRARLATA